MTPEVQKQRVEMLRKAARKILDSGTWAKVMGVFGYQNHHLARNSEAEFDNLKSAFKAAELQNMVAFVDIVHFEEELHGTAMSFNMNTMRRPTKEDEASPEKDLMMLFSSQNILIGTRNGQECAIDWLKNFVKAAETLPHESALVIDKIFGEALEFFKGTSKKMTVGEMITSAISEDASLLEPRPAPLKQ
jgi:hypothetical protein